MISRVSFALRYETLTSNMLSKEAEVKKLQEAIAKGRGLLKPSDDPIAWRQAMDFKSASKEIEQWQKNIQFAMSWSRTTEGALNHLNDLLTRAREIAIKAIKVNSEETRTAYKEELKQIKDEVKLIEDLKYRDRWVFHRPPDDPVQVKVGKNKTMIISVSEEEVFGTAPDSISDHIQQLYDAIDSNNVNDISTSMGDIEADQQRVLSVMTKVGAAMNRLDARNNVLASIMIENEDRTGDLEKTDMTQLATEYQLKKTALQAIYQTTASISGLTLLRYI